MNYEAYIPEALAIVAAWDIPLEDFAAVVRDHAKILAGAELDPMSDPFALDMDYPVTD